MFINKILSIIHATSQQQASNKPATSQQQASNKPATSQQQARE
jgi:hypothetical protein